MERKTYVSFIVLFYNQEAYAEEAIIGALSQDYDNCEIILSDDCSSDNTFQVIKDTVAKCKSNKKIIINRNDKNLGLIKHINKVLFELSNGEIICLAGGDDISLPNRVSYTVKRFQDNPNLTAVSMSYKIIDKDGKVIGENKKQETETLSIGNIEYLYSDAMMWGLGGLSISRKVLDVFGKLNDDCQTEDSVLRFRSIMIGEVLVSNIIGLKYRVHGNNMSIGPIVYKLKTQSIAFQYRKDLDTAKQYLEYDLYRILKQKIKYYVRCRNLSERSATSNFILLKLFFRIVRYMLLFTFKIKKLVTKVNFKKIKKGLIGLYNLAYYCLHRKNIIPITGYMNFIGSRVVPQNFGDDINYDLIKYFSGNERIINIQNILFHKLFQFNNYACIGSIIDIGCLNNNSTIWGSGCMFGNMPISPKKVLSVRGALTRKVMIENGIECPEIYGDPALLLPLIYPCKLEKKYKYGLIPHFKDLNLENVIEFKKQYKDSAIIIDLKHYKKWQDIVNQINECEFIISSSLHGLIVSDAYGVPNIWIKLSNNVTGGYFKFWDYFSSVKRKQEYPIDLMNKRIEPKNLIDKLEYKPIIIDTDQIISNCPFLSK